MTLVIHAEGEVPSQNKYLSKVTASRAGAVFLFLLVWTRVMNFTQINRITCDD